MSDARKDETRKDFGYYIKTIFFTDHLLVLG